MEVVAQTCDTHLLINQSVGHNFMDSECVQTLFDVAPRFNETLFFCKYRNFTDTCDKLFAPTITEEGICYTFNAMPGKDIYRSDV